jgi:hypothetical protein
MKLKVYRMIFYIECSKINHVPYLQLRFDPLLTKETFTITELAKECLL